LARVRTASRSSARRSVSAVVSPEAASSRSRSRAPVASAHASWSSRWSPSGRASAGSASRAPRPTNSSARLARSRIRASSRAARGGRSTAESRPARLAAWQPTIADSSTLMPRKGWIFWKVRTMPSRTRARGRSPVTGREAEGADDALEVSDPLERGLEAGAARVSAGAPEPLGQEEGDVVVLGSPPVRHVGVAAVLRLEGLAVPDDPRQARVPLRQGLPYRHGHGRQVGALEVGAGDPEQRLDAGHAESEVAEHRRREADLRLLVDDEGHGGAAAEHGEPVRLRRLDLRELRDEVLVGGVVVALRGEHLDAMPARLVRERLGGGLVVEVDR